MVGSKLGRTLGTAFVAVLVSAALVLGVRSASPATGAGGVSGAGPEGESFVHLFDSASKSFVFTFTIPTGGADPTDVVVVPGAGHEDVWFTLTGADRIGRLTYTDTNDYTFCDYTLTAGSAPLNLVSGGGFIWFTEAGRDRIGRLDPATGQVDEFRAPAGSYPADLDYAADDSVWFTEMKKDSIAKLVVSSPDDYEVEEYATAALDGGRPYGLVVDRSSVWFAQTENDLVTRYSPPSSWLQLRDLTGRTDAPNGPYKLALRGRNEVWASEHGGNRITMFKPGTFPNPITHDLSPANSVPMGIAADPGTDYVWFTQWAAGQMGRYRAGSGLEYYPLPHSDLAPTGVGLGSGSNVWVLAARPYRVYLPLIAHLGG